MSTHIILWEKSKPVLYCYAMPNKNMWEVVNGGWSLLLEGQEGLIVKTGTKLHFDHKTVAPAGKNYTDVINSASLEDEHISWDAEHPEVKPIIFEDEVAF